MYSGRRDCIFNIQCTLVSNNSVHNRIQNLSHDIKDNIFSRISQMKFSIQLYEYTGVARLVVLITFVWYELSSFFHEDILFCKSHPFSTSEN